MANIGEKIKAQRLALGYSQDYLAKLLGYKNRSTIAKIESGKNDISQTKIYEFARALNCSPSDLLDINEFTEPDRDALREISQGRIPSNYRKHKKFDLTELMKDNSSTGRVHNNIIKDLLNTPTDEQEASYLAGIELGYKMAIENLSEDEKISMINQYIPNTKPEIAKLLLDILKLDKDGLEYVLKSIELSLGKTKKDEKK